LYHQAILNSIISYGASVWSHRVLQNKNLANKINSVQRKILIRMTGAYNTVSNDALTVVLGVIPLHLGEVRRGFTYWIKKENPSKVQYITSTPVYSLQEWEQWITEHWQRLWTQSTKRRRLYNIFARIGERLTMDHLQPGRGLTHFLTGHSPYKNELHILRLSDDNLCECGIEDSPSIQPSIVPLQKML
jgi:hypothetical protein